MHAISVEGLTKRFGKKVVAVDNLDFTIRAGVVTGFLGRNGAGKTTTLRMILGLARPTHGHARINGKLYHELENPWTVVGSVLDSNSVHPGRSARNHLRWVAAAAGLPESRIDEVLALVGLTDAAGRRVKGYSLGMRQRLALATALLGDPDILVLDEPANGLDPQGMRWLRDFLVQRAKSGKTVLVSSHILAELAQFADDIIVIERGRMVKQGSLAELTQSLGGAAVRVRTPEAGKLTAALEAQGGVVKKLSDDELQVTKLTLSQVGELALSAGAPVHSLSEELDSLEDIFLSLTTGHENLEQVA